MFLQRKVQCGADWDVAVGQTFVGVEGVPLKEFPSQFHSHHHISTVVQSIFTLMQQLNVLRPVAEGIVTAESLQQRSDGVDILHSIEAEDFSFRRFSEDHLVVVQ